MQAERLVPPLPVPPGTARKRVYEPTSGLGLSPAEAEGRVAKMRDIIKKMVKFAKKELSAPCGRWLQDQCNKGGFLLEWAPNTGKAAHIIWDKQAQKKGAESIVLNGGLLIALSEPDREVDQALPVCADPLFVLMTAVVVHETLHAGQEVTSSNPPDPLREIRDTATHEIEAHNKSREYLEKWLNDLCNPQNSNYLVCSTGSPTSSNPCFKKAIDVWGGLWEALAPASNPQNKAYRQAQFDKLKERVQSYVAAANESIQCYTNIVTWLNDLLMGNISMPQFVALLRNGEAWRLVIDGFFRSQPAPNSGPPSRDCILRVGTGGVLHQSVLPFVAPTPAATQLPLFSTGMASVTSIAVIMTASGRNLLVSGVTGSGTGELQVYGDIEGDGWFDPSTQQILFSNEPRLGSRAHIFANSDLTQYYVFDSVGQVVMDLLDSDGDSIPDQLGEDLTIPSNNLSQLAGFEFDPYATVPTMVGQQFSDWLPVRVSGVFDIITLSDTDGDGFFETEQTVSVIDQYGFAPHFEPLSLVAGSSAIEFYALSGLQMEAWQVDPSNGNRISLIGTATAAGPTQATAITTTVPLVAGQAIELVESGPSGRSAYAYISGSSNIVGGVGCASSAGLPGLEVASVPDIGSDIRFDLDNAPPAAATFFVLGFATANHPLPSASGCTVYPQPVGSMFALTDLSGAATFDLPIPPIPIGIGITTRFQALLIDPPANPLGVATSNGLDVILGGQQ